MQGLAAADGGGARGGVVTDAPAGIPERAAEDLQGWYLAVVDAGERGRIAAVSQAHRAAPDAPLRTVISPGAQSDDLQDVHLRRGEAAGFPEADGVARLRGEGAGALVREIGKPAPVHRPVQRPEQ